MEANNNKAMREALTKVSEWMAHRIATGGFEASPTFPTVLEDVVLPALAEPPRNCDVGTEHEQYERFERYCDNFGRYSNGEPKCDDCPLLRRVVKEGGKCEFVWGQMPYESEAKA